MPFTRIIGQAFVHKTLLSSCVMSHLLNPPPLYVYLVIGVEQRKEMTDTIKADLERLFPTGCGDHFLVPARQELLLSVLSLWADLHPATGYRQGMHEVRWKVYPGCCDGREWL